MVEPIRVSDSTDSSTQSSSPSSPSSSSPSSPESATSGSTAPAAGSPARPRKGPLSFLSGSLTSFGFAWLALQLSSRVVAYYGEHPPHYDARFAQSIAVFMKTLIVGMTFLATFTFAFVGLGLFLTFIRSLLPGWRPLAEAPQPAAPEGAPAQRRESP